MPRIAINYETTLVSFYRFVCNDPEIKSSYVGSTVNFTERKANHKKCCNNPNDKVYHLKIYETIRDNGGWNNWRMIEIESRLVKDKREAERIEQEWIEKMETDMNSIKAFGAETREEYKKQYHMDNREKNIEYSKQYYIENTNTFKEQSKQYRLENADKIKEHSKQYRLENADKIKEKTKEKVACECGCEIRRGDLPRHQKSPKHAKLMELKIASII